MQDWDDLLELDEERFEENPEREVSRTAYDLATSDKASTEIDIKKFSPPSSVPDEKHEELKENLKTSMEHESKFSVGACQPESDGDIVCRFKSEGVRDVQMQKGTRTVPVPVSFEAMIHLKDFDEARADEMEEIRIDESRTIIS